MRAFRGFHFLSLVFVLVALIATPPTPARAENGGKPFRPAIIFLGEESDNPYINSARNGIARAEGELRTTVTVTKMKPSDNATEVIKKVVDEGASPIILLGGQYVAPVLALAERYPGTNFTIVDGLVPPIYPNVQSVLFKDNEGAFLVGMIAGKLSKSGLVGFIGGMDVPLIRNFAVGFQQGVKYASSNVNVDTQMIGTTADAWNNPKKAHEIARLQYEEGADIVFAAAGASTLGVLKAADEMNKFAIGVDTNQNGVYPGRVLTSLVKRVDFVVYDTLKNSKEGTWSAGIKYLGVKEGALDYAVDQNNRNLISERLIEQVATAKDRIINGSLVVESYSAK